MVPKALLVLFTVLDFSTAGQGYHETLETIATENHLIGMSVGVVCQGGLTDLYHFGLADITRSIPVTDSTMYRIASISKSVTATALMHLYEKGAFELDDNVSDDLGFSLIHPLFPATPVTFRMLLSHTSGLQDGTGYSYFLQATSAQSPPPNLSLLLTPGGTYFTNDMWLNHQPGTWFNYSNINYGVIGTLIERLSGIRFDIYVRDSILRPLGIKGSFNVNDIVNINNVAVLYRNSIPQADNYQGVPPAPVNLTGYVIGSNGLIFSPAGGLRISASDLSRFMILHTRFGVYDTVRLLDSATVAVMHETNWNFTGNNGNTYSNLFRRWGLGFHLTTNAPGGDIVIPGIPMTGHPGEAYGLISDMYFEHQKEFGLIFVTNGYSGSQGYQYGNYSAFYIPEEEVFAAINEFQYPGCFMVNITDRGLHKGIWYDPATGIIHFPDDQGAALVTVVSMTGQRLFNAEATGGYAYLPRLSNGLFIVRVISSGNEFVNKILIHGQ